MVKSADLIRLRRISSREAEYSLPSVAAAKPKVSSLTGGDELLFCLSWHRNPDQNIVSRHSMSERLTAVG